MGDNITTNYPLYAQKFSELPVVVGYRYIVYRDLPELVAKYVKGTKTLDYGCGPGHSYKFLKALGLKVDGVDINEHMIKVAKERNPDGMYRVIKSAEIPTINDYYDFVYCSFVLVYIDTKAELFKIVKEIARVLKPGGTFIALVTNEVAYKHNWLEEDFDFEENKSLVSGSLARMGFKGQDYTLVHYYWTEEDYRQIISNSGLEVVCIHTPLGKDTDGVPWLDETKFGGMDMYIAKKRLNVGDVN